LVGIPYYYNPITKKTTWELPKTQEDTTQIIGLIIEKLPPPWVHFYTDTGLIYYYNPENGVTTWEVPIQDAITSVEDTVLSIQDTEVHIDDTKVSVQDPIVSAQDSIEPEQVTNVSVEDPNVTVEDTAVFVQDTNEVTAIDSNYVDVDDTNLLTELNAVTIDDETTIAQDYNDRGDDDLDTGAEDVALIDELTNLVIEEYTEAHDGNDQDSSKVEDPFLFKKIRTIKNLDTGEEFILDDSEEAAMIFDTFGSVGSSNSSRSNGASRINDDGINGKQIRTKPKVFGIKSLLKKMNLNDQ